MNFCMSVSGGEIRNVFYLGVVGKRASYTGRVGHHVVNHFTRAQHGLVLRIIADILGLCCGRIVKLDTFCQVLTRDTRGQVASGDEGRSTDLPVLQERCAGFAPVTLGWTAEEGSLDGWRQPVGHTPEHSVGNLFSGRMRKKEGRGGVCHPGVDLLDTSGERRRK